MRPRISRSRACRTTSASLTRQLAATLGTVDDRGAEQRALFRRWPTGVSVVVAEAGGRRAGLTVNSLVSLSLDPPLVGISLALSASLYEVLRDAGEWAVSMLAADQEGLAQHFARSIPPIALWDGIAVRDDDPVDLLRRLGKADALVHVARPLGRAHAHHVPLRALVPAAATLVRQRLADVVPHLLRVDQDTVEVEDDSPDHSP